MKTKSYQVGTLDLRLLTKPEAKFHSFKLMNKKTCLWQGDCDSKVATEFVNEVHAYLDKLEMRHHKSPLPALIVTQSLRKTMEEILHHHDPQPGHGHPVYAVKGPTAASGGSPRKPQRQPTRRAA